MSLSIVEAQLVACDMTVTVNESIVCNSQAEQQHAHDGYSRRGNSNAVVICIVVIIYSPDGTNSLMAQGRRCRALKVVKHVHRRPLPIHLFRRSSCRMYR